MAQESIKLIIQNFIKELNRSGIIVDTIILFGSYLKNNFDDNSDIDIVVISPLFDSDFSREDIITLWNCAAKIDSRIEPVHCGVKQWEFDDSSAIIEIARREGTAVSAA